MIISFVNYKGGTGKTTSCISLAGSLAKQGKDVLVVDLDPQGNATTTLGIDKRDLKSSMHDVMTKRKNIKRIILATNTENIHVAPSNHNLAKVNLTSYKRKSDAEILKKALDGIKNYHDYILIDTPPIYSHFIINGMVASDEIISILDPGIFSLRGLNALETDFKDFLKKIGFKIKIDTALVVKSQDSILPWKEKYAKKTSDEIKRKFNKKVFMVPYSDHIHETNIRKIPISHYKPNSKIARVYKELADQYTTIPHKKIREFFY